MSFLKNIRSKPKHVRAQIAFVSAAALTGLIVLVWMSSLPTRIASREAEPPQKEGESGFIASMRELFVVMKGGALSSAGAVTTFLRDQRSESEEVPAIKEEAQESESNEEAPLFSESGLPVTDISDTSDVDLEGEEPAQREGEDQIPVLIGTSSGPQKEENME